MRRALLALALVWALGAQTANEPPQTPLLNNTQAVALYTRSVQLIESTMVAAPELSRPGAPLLDSIKMDKEDRT